MSTIKFNELSTKSTLLLTDLLAVSDSNGILYKEDLQTFVNFFDSASGVSFRGSLAIADTPTLDGWYFATESGTYTNAGGLVVDVSDNIVIIIVTETQTTFSKVDIPVTINFDSIPVEGSTNAVESGGVYNYVKQTSENKNIIPNADFRGFVSLGSVGLVGYSTNGAAELVSNTDVPFGFSTKAVKIPLNIGDNINVYTGTKGTDIIFEDGDKYSCGIWLYNDNWAGYDGVFYCIDTHTGLYFTPNVIDVNNGWRFYYANNQIYTLANGGIQLRVNLDATSATVNTNFYISSPAIIQGTFINPKIYSNFLDTLDVESTYITSNILNNDVFFRNKNYLVNKNANYSANELTIIDAIVDIIPLKIPSGELADTFRLIVFAGSQDTYDYRIQIKNITTDVVVFDTFTTLGKKTYTSQNYSIVRTPAAGAGTHDFLIYIDYTKITSPTFLYQNSAGLIDIVIGDLGKKTNPISKEIGLQPLFNDLTGKNWSKWGDSISANKGYWSEQSNQYLQMTTDVKAVGGDNIQDQIDDLDALLISDSTYFDDKALVSFMCVFNTWTQNYTLGSITDASGTASFYGKMKQFIDTVLGANAFVKLVLMTQYITTNTANSNGDTQSDFNVAVKEIGLLYALPVIDWGADSGCNPLNAGGTGSNYDRLNFTMDGTHPSRYGGEILGKYFAKQLLTRVQTFF